MDDAEMLDPEPSAILDLRGDIDVPYIRLHFAFIF